MLYQRIIMNKKKTKEEAIHKRVILNARAAIILLGLCHVSQSPHTQKGHISYKYATINHISNCAQKLESGCNITQTIYTYKIEPKMNV